MNGTAGLDWCVYDRSSRSSDKLLTFSFRVRKGHSPAAVASLASWLPTAVRLTCRHRAREKREMIAAG
jgi:hypothetical protein